MLDSTSPFVFDSSVTILTPRVTSFVNPLCLHISRLTSLSRRGGVLEIEIMSSYLSILSCTRHTHIFLFRTLIQYTRLFTLQHRILSRIPRLQTSQNPLWPQTIWTSLVPKVGGYHDSIKVCEERGGPG